VQQRQRGGAAEADRDGALEPRPHGALDAEAAGLERGEAPVPRLRAASWLDGRQVEIDTGTERIAGLVAGIADDGSLLLDGPAGRVALSVGEVVRVTELPPVGVPS